MPETRVKYGPNAQSLLMPLCLFTLLVLLGLIYPHGALLTTCGDKAVSEAQHMSHLLCVGTCCGLMLCAL